MADPIYEKYGLDDREPEFKRLYQHLFAKWGFADILRDGFDDFPALRDKTGIVLVRGVLKEDQEGVDVLRKWGVVEEKLAREFEEAGKKVYNFFPLWRVTFYCNVEKFFHRAGNMRRDALEIR